jgi:hypothetical protein
MSVASRTNPHGWGQRVLEEKQESDLKDDVSSAVLEMERFKAELEDDEEVDEEEW